MHALKSIIACLFGSESINSLDNKKHTTTTAASTQMNYSTFTEKQQPQQQSQPTTPSEAAEQILALLLSAPHPSAELKARTQALTTRNSAVNASSSRWAAAVARAVLRAMESALKAGKAHSGAMGTALEKAEMAAAELGEFVKAHPVFFTVLALGVLVLLAPAVIHALGFGALGPVEGSFAAAWQSTYGGYVEVGSLFSYLQKLGMLY
ncbi:uncharacterized protein K452DRAFT_305431 [Aplosporella prunicola CBS 121167]|uniref:Uncharacterized protein n=1 Tax=Aplosporella prunicola CBS 121167 TaxID=1176127 RepID=A0A6A6BPM1_9PEZI|nr:uncharacterized protein K452DRAFT_305431 [Aplosporella prunicola CBS 121167]KAF2145403.1 hypothetical protein K452DRAFT_305431 [Aplosporella prunicola CBS 121167]